MTIVYADSNMDMLYEDGRSYCLPEIKDATISDDKTINDVAFGNGRMVVATSFGIVIYDDGRREVVESGIYRTPVESVAICGDNLLIYSPYSLMFSKLTDRHNTMSSFVRLGGMYTDRMVDISDNKIAWTNLNNHTLMVSTIDFDNKRLSNNATNISINS